jgi:hypothetical protein
MGSESPGAVPETMRLPTLLGDSPASYNNPPLEFPAPWLYRREWSV